jgi:hypothetical protein
MQDTGPCNRVSPVCGRPVPQPDSCHVRAFACLLRTSADMIGHCVWGLIDLLLCRGIVGEVVWPQADTVRVDTWIAPGTVVSASFDSLLAKIMVHGRSREEAVGKMVHALASMRVKGIATNAQLLQAVLSSSAFSDPKYTTSLISELAFDPSFAEVCPLPFPSALLTGRLLTHLPRTPHCSQT